MPPVRPPLPEGKVIRVRVKNPVDVRVSDEDYEHLLQLKLAVSKDGYVAIVQGNKLQNLGRYLLQASDPLLHVDHHNNVRTDYRRGNLALVSAGHNAQNKAPRPNRIHNIAFRGVKFNLRIKSYEASIHFRKRRIYLGSFSLMQQAAQAYNYAAYTLYGERAAFNALTEPVPIDIEHIKAKLDSALRKISPVLQDPVTHSWCATRDKSLPFETQEEAAVYAWELIHTELTSNNSTLSTLRITRASSKTHEANSVLRVAQTDGSIRFTRVDEERWSYLTRFQWHNSNGYAFTTISVAGVSFPILMHRLLMKAKPGELVDHISGDRLDNRLANLRKVDAKTNSRNRHKSTTRSTTTRYVGVSTSPSRKGFCVRVNGRFAGRYPTAEIAAFAYDQTCRQIDGDSSVVRNNVPEPEGWKWSAENLRMVEVVPSRPRGVCFCKERRLYRVYVPEKEGEKKRRFFGFYKSKAVAALAFNHGALLVQGPSAKLNKVADQPDWRWDAAKRRMVPTAPGDDNATPPVDAQGGSEEARGAPALSSASAESPAESYEKEEEHKEDKEEEEEKLPRYKGVSFRTSRNVWRARAAVEGGREAYFGCYRSARTAALAYNHGVLELHGPRAELNAVSEQPGWRWDAAQKRMVRASAAGAAPKYLGVSLRKSRGVYRARMKQRDGRQEYLGSYFCARVAALAYNHVALQTLGRDAVLNEVGEQAGWRWDARRRRMVETEDCEEPHST